MRDAVGREAAETQGLGRRNQGEEKLLKPRQHSERPGR